MKIKTALVSTLIIAILLSACSSVATPTSGQNLPVENKPQSATEPAAAELTTIEPATVEPVLVEPATAEPTVQKMTTLKVNSAIFMSYAPIFIAEKEGFFEEYGIKVEYLTFNNSAERLALLISGGLDIDAGNLNAGILNVVGQEPNIKVVADRGHAQPGECTYQGILVRKDLFESGQITNAAGLKGQVVSSSTTGTTGFFLSNYLAQANLTLKDVNISDIPNAGEIDAFANKTLAAIVATEPDITRILNAGNAVLLVGSQDAIGTFQSSLMTFGKHLVVDDRDAGARFLAGYLKGVKQYNEGKTERNLQIIAESTGESIDLLKAACWVPIRDDGLIDFASVDALQKWLIEQKQLDNPVTQEQFWDPSFLAAAMKLLNP